MTIKESEKLINTLLKGHFELMASELIEENERLKARVLFLEQKQLKEEDDEEYYECRGCDG